MDIRVIKFLFNFQVREEVRRLAQKMVDRPIKMEIKFFGWVEREESKAITRLEKVLVPFFSPLFFSVVTSSGFLWLISVFNLNVNVLSLRSKRPFPFSPFSLSLSVYAPHMHLLCFLHCLLRLMAQPETHLLVGGVSLKN